MRVVLLSVAAVLALFVVISSVNLSVTEPSVATVDDGIGLIVFESPYGVTRTADRLESMAQERGLNVLTRIDHAAGAAEVDRTLRPTVVVLFGNPNVGTPFMQCDQTVGIDLPQKALIWENERGMVQLAFNDPSHLATRHGVVHECHDVAARIEQALTGLGQAVVESN